MKRAIILLMATLVAGVSTVFSQDWDKKLIDQLKEDKSVEKSIVVNRNHDTRKIETESLTFRFSSKKLFGKIYDVLMAHQDEAERFSSDDSSHSITMRTYKNGLYSLYNLNGSAKYVFKVYRSVEKPSESASSTKRVRQSSSRKSGNSGRVIVRDSYGCPIEITSDGEVKNSSTVEKRNSGNVAREAQSNEERVKRAAAERARKLK